MTHTMAPEQLSLFAEQPVPNRFPVVTSPIVSDLLAAHAPVALGVSGGKDSGAMALAVTRYLDERGHRGPRLLIHSDLGRVEWRESLPMCQQLADHLGLELVVVRRQAGDLLDRWQVRWRTNVARYADLETVRLILPWSTPAMLFCRSELKAAIICRELVQRFPGMTIISGTGIRREESAARAAAPISAPQPRLSNQTHRTSGHDWHPIVEWTREQVLAYHSLRRFPLHPAYGQGMTRVSCAYCVMSSLADLQTSARCPENQELYRELVELEILSSFAFQSGHWLGDIAPWLLSESQQRRLAEAKRRAAIREQAEARIPCHLLYTKGWPTSIPTMEEAALLAEVRRIVAETLELSIDYRDPEAIRARYAELMDARPQKASREMASHAQASVERTRQPLLLGSFERRGEDA
jgi:3'-phosphoadenosine 5'-phosphosulfate sulfotransferase (PAPS reductase)/FAD synthetase